MIPASINSWDKQVGWLLALVITWGLLQPQVLVAQSDPDCDNLTPADCSNAYIAHGRELYLASNFEVANQAFTEAIALTPESLNAYLWRGAGLWAIEAYAAAYADLDSALQLDYDLAWTYHLTGRPIHENTIDIYRYVTRYRLAAADDPALAAAYANRRELYNLGGHSGLSPLLIARVELESAVRTAPINTRLRYQLGILHNAVGRYDLADQTLTDALILDPDFVDAYRLRAENFIQLNQLAKAVEDYSKAIDRSPNDADLHIWRAAQYSVLGDSESATADFNTALTLEPDNVLIYFARAFSHLGYPERAFEATIEDLNTSIQIDPGFAPAYFLRAGSYIQLNRNDEALKDLLRAEALGMTDPVVYGALGMVYDRVGDYTAAADYYRRYVALLESPTQYTLDRIAEFEAQGY
ncbi:MAG TPA: tetratricopeptide repeat protein [Aggregatilineales bacterium]|nr:tetratricopeptide repeat protein [Aggregatilineales bacterium]